MLKMHPTVDQLWNNMWNEKQIYLVDKLFSKKFSVYYSGGSVSSHTDFKSLLSNWFIAFPDLKHTVLDYIEQENRIVTRWSGLGTHEGIFLEIQPTFKKFIYNGITIFHLSEEGKIHEAWVANHLTDQLAELRAK